MMNEDFVSYDLAVKLKEKGYPIQFEKVGKFGLTKIETVIVPPTIAQALKWLREEKKIFVDVNSFPTYSTKEMVAYAVDVRCNSDGYSMENVESAQSFARWEEAALAGIEYVLNNLI